MRGIDLDGVQLMRAPEGFGQPVRALRNRDSVSVVRHQGVGQDSDAHLRTYRSEYVEVKPVIPGGEEDLLLLGPLERGRPFVALKYGMTLDARLGREGRPTRVTGEAAEAEVHRLRSGFDAILVGGRTARTDDPALTVRLAAPGRIPPVRVVADAGVVVRGRTAA